MAKRRTREELEKSIHDLGAYQEAFWALQRGEKPLRVSTDPEGLSSDFSERTVWLLALGRASGGVVLLDPSGLGVTYAERWASDASHSPDPYRASLGRKVFALVADAIKERCSR
jgi:hypothetical protein